MARRTTLTATPWRGRVLAAKALVVGGAVSVAGLIATRRVARCFRHPPAHGTLVARRSCCRRQPYRVMPRGLYTLSAVTTSSSTRPPIVWTA
jgi:hypothetical protein